MSGQELQLNLITLLLGFILIEVMSGLMRTLRARLPTAPGRKDDVHIGWLTPMLAAYTMLNILFWWLTIGGHADRIPVGYDAITTGLILCCLYYFAASLIFPDQPRNWPNVDEWFWLHRRQVLISLLIADIPVTLLDFFAQVTHNELMVTIVALALKLGSQLLAITSRNYRVVFVSLAMLVALHLSFIPLNMLFRFDYL